MSVAIYCELMTCRTDQTKVDIHYGALAIENVKKLDLQLFFQNRSKSRFLPYSTTSVDRTDKLKGWTSGADVLAYQGPSR